MPKALGVCERWTLFCNTATLVNLGEDLSHPCRWYFQEWTNVFAGSDLVTWLVTNGVASSREVATAYGQDLLKGRVLEHVTREHYFYDDAFYYKFLI